MRGSLHNMGGDNSTELHRWQDLLEAPMTDDVDLQQEYWKRTISDRVKEQVYEYARNVGTDEDDISAGFRTHLGASVIGNPCLRFLYYHFHWFKRDSHSGRMENIFQKGHEFEAKMRKVMRSLGAQFLDDVDETGKQLVFSVIGGHFGGSVDGIFIWPAIGITEPTLLECKTSKTGAPFTDLPKKGIMQAKWQHYVQQNVYMQGFGLKYALYIVENKNDCDLYIEMVEFAPSVAKDATKNAQFIILGNELPPKISSKRNFHLCNMCSMQTLCHDGEAPEPNCRNCRNSEAHENKEWFCLHWQAVIPDENAILKGCLSHEFRPY